MLCPSTAVVRPATCDGPAGPLKPIESVDTVESGGLIIGTAALAVSINPPALVELAGIIEFAMPPDSAKCAASFGPPDSPALAGPPETINSTGLDGETTRTVCSTLLGRVVDVTPAYLPLRGADRGALGGFDRRREVPFQVPRLREFFIPVSGPEVVRLPFEAPPYFITV
jgi:hypothetical protein